MQNNSSEACVGLAREKKMEVTWWDDEGKW